MGMTDPIADYLTRIRNANMAKHDSVEVPASNMKKSISEILKREGFIRDYEVADDNKQGMIKIFLKYGPNGERCHLRLKKNLQARFAQLR
jgi:small subunit ribosomal protein S8